MIGEPRDWVDYWTFAIAAIALAVSVVSLLVSWRTQRLSEQAEVRRQPRLGLRLLQCESLTDRHRMRQFHIEIQISNRSDNDNAVALIELRIGYDVAGAPVSYRLPLESTPTLPSPTPLLANPLRLAAHETIQGWCVFELDKALLGSRNLDDYVLIVEDNHGNSNALPIQTISERPFSV